MLTGNTNTEKVRNYLLGKGLPEPAVFGLMGNIQEESAFKPKNLQNSYEKKLGMTDDSYTAAVDNGSYQNFAGDAAGYGLCQWTSSGRKAALLQHMRARGLSIGDLEGQLDFLWVELTGSYKGVLSTIRAAGSIREASDIVLTKFERPADQSEAAKRRRASNGQKLCEEYKVGSAPIYTAGRTYELQVNLNVRSGPGTECVKKGHEELTEDGKRHDTSESGVLDAGTHVTCLEVRTVGGDVWMRTPSGWLAAYHQGKKYIN